MTVLQILADLCQEQNFHFSAQQQAGRLALIIFPNLGWVFVQRLHFVGGAWGIQVQFLSRFCIVWNVPHFGPKYTSCSTNERKSLVVGLGDFEKHKAAEFCNSLAWFSVWCVTSAMRLPGFDLRCFTNSRTKSWISTKFKNYQGKKKSPGLGAWLWKSF